MKRSNTFDVRPRSAKDAELLHRVLDASASLWNELNYERRQSYFGDGDVFETDDYRKRYVGVLGSATAQQVIRRKFQRGAHKPKYPTRGVGETCLRGVGR